ncbi:hypothetical protein Poli38472_012568 [Pythium oligandrum]|uniref:FYVE-type domain-containing protein n=1 Tax=Pythium oligandrum TaxID=41045 RepID=A0A8K1CFT7_PYTOL|nr:hypothetical protein Poli38472_012568 [Pythium oligandrum]|eukprot:TMW61377.1 hypothetical protein Poli38472_012568 [Pythium oligandrum]
MKSHPSCLDVFRPLNLSASEERAIADEAGLVIQRTLTQEAEFRKQGGRINLREWKQVRVEDGLAVYKQRKVPRTGYSSSMTDIDGDQEVSVPELLSNTAQSAHSGNRWRFASMDLLEFATTISSSSGSNSGDSRVPAMLAAGHIEGKLEDAMLGIFDGDEHAWKVRAGLIKDKFDEAQILATIRAPSEDEPFNFLGIKWFSVEYPKVVGSFIQKRDTLVMEALGIGIDENGGKYGYSLLHDFRHPNLPELKELGMLRSKLSMCFIFRQTSPTRVSLYSRGFVDGGGDLPKSIAIAITALSIVSNANAVETAYSRKLAWLVNSQAPQRRIAREEQRQSSSCRSCDKTPKLRGLTECHACGFSFCTKCTVHRKVVVGKHDTSVHSLSFCFGCVLQAKGLSPVEIARVTYVPSSDAP